MPTGRRSVEDPSSSTALTDLTDLTISLQLSLSIQDNPCHVLEIPAELKNKIYIHSLTLPEPLLIIIRDPDVITLASNQAAQLGVTLLATCKRINTEATPILYSLNTISLRNGVYVPPILEALHPGAHHIHNIEISHLTRGEVASLVEYLPRLQTLQNIIVHGDMCRYTNDPLRIVERLGPLVKALRTKCRESGKKAVMEMFQLPLSGQDGQWWMQVQEGVQETIEFLDGADRNGGRVSNL
ncbi:hypothetical protein CLAFUW4_13202 [Fulvia fulva]|uniref:Uncharacterized protein n=1 Tax=Passalora fulva TaxID=5499 RepID=A0A9Q8PJJ6_PASFU|nr:uncharacterized protein CLAFUR5_13058 [Fulvia fulva]KAK4611924.1 hypothetical protein CLAFUR4_13207 [Fulvia fulva]KAK4612915.1 hypothetical protein CLAFUR0_13211 [Fulvia fulva]UJO23539.1 hypothetical protein CLAFUR5_13058 [Fulvia fulva]WPV21515.1 hypothetical protein CLAFUW4_13202 [Fulvia fulva]WPV35812.1 hypothetical protein CLAFUW7_13210 [Fulvia fulva]